MRKVYKVYNKFTDVIMLQTESETSAIEFCDELNESFKDINPFDRPWVVSSEYDDSFDYDDYREK